MKKMLFLFLTLIACQSNQSKLETVAEVDLKQYIGTWYEIARFQHSFEKNLTCITATYSLREDGKIKVVNRGHRISDETKVEEREGVAWAPNPDEPAKLKVRFFFPFSGHYWVLALDSNYQYALIGDPSRKYLWILSKTPQLDETIYAKLVETAKQKEFAVEGLIRVKQTCAKK